MHVPYFRTYKYSHTYIDTDIMRKELLIYLFYSILCQLRKEMLKYFPYIDIMRKEKLIRSLIFYYDTYYAIFILYPYYAILILYPSYAISIL